MTDIKLPPLPQPFAHQSERVQEHVRVYAREAVRLNACESHASTHADNCWSWGHGHYECAVREIEQLREALETMVEMVEMNGFGRAYAMDVARAALAAHRKGDQL